LIGKSIKKPRLKKRNIKLVILNH